MDIQRVDSIWDDDIHDGIGGISGGLPAVRGGRLGCRGAPDRSLSLASDAAAAAAAAAAASGSAGRLTSL
eukprot:2535121-Pleurochrysis_carterae.AAC.1